MAIETIQESYYDRGINGSQSDDWNIGGQIA